jgi:hypothetical protein
VQNSPFLSHGLKRILHAGILTYCVGLTSDDCRESQRDLAPLSGH